MDKSKNSALAIVLLALSSGTIAAEQVSHQPAQQQRMGVISVSGSPTLSALEGELADKAKKQGAKSFRIIAVTGDNRLHGTAVIYR